MYDKVLIYFSLTMESHEALVSHCEPKMSHCVMLPTGKWLVNKKETPLSRFSSHPQGDSTHFPGLSVRLRKMFAQTI